MPTVCIHATPTRLTGATPGPLSLLCALVVALGATNARGDMLAPLPVDPTAIIGGGPSLPCAWPSTVFLGNCTGTLIHPEIVVYAARCGDNHERVWFGEEVSGGDLPSGQGFSVETEYCMLNPAWGEGEEEMEVGARRATDFAFCKLAAPVLDVPIVPPAMGCETTALLPGTPVTLVGYGGTDQATFGVKFELQTVLHYIDDFEVAVIGGGGFGPCVGDVGGPAFVRMPDGTWRSFGIMSGADVGTCGDAMLFSTIYTAVPFIEANSGIDVSVCHHSYGEWNPSPECGGAPLDPGNGAGKSWANGCAGGPTSGLNATCGDPFDTSVDLVAPSVRLRAPGDRARFDTGPGAQTVLVVVEADASDEGSGVSRVDLLINGGSADDSLRLGPPYEWSVTLASGVWEIQVRATDWAGNGAVSEAAVVGIDEDPPEPSATADGSDGDSPDPRDSEATGHSGDGCSCGQSGHSGGGWVLSFVLLGLLSRRRRWAAVAVPLALAGGCADNATGSPGSSSTSVTSSGVSDVDTTVTTITVSGSEGFRCELGSADCGCLADLTCGDGLLCSLDTCVGCESGTMACPCSFDDGAIQGSCNEGLFCFGGLCASPMPCPFVEDGQCDEARGTGRCLAGTDRFDCCAVETGVCEERSVGGRCPDGSDPQDCGTDSGSESGASTGSTTTAPDIPGTSGSGSAGALGTGGTSGR